MTHLHVHVYLRNFTVIGYCDFFSRTVVFTISIIPRNRVMRFQLSLIIPCNFLFKENIRFPLSVDDKFLEYIWGHMNSQEGKFQNPNPQTLACMWEPDMVYKFTLGMKHPVWLFKFILIELHGTTQITINRHLYSFRSLKILQIQVTSVTSQ